jgi:hypothetical protein
MRSFALSLLLLALSLTYASCIQDECKDIVCSNGGVCVLGNCSCLNGYEGPNCTEVWNARFVGQWYSENKPQETFTSLQDSFAKAKRTVTEFSLISNGRADQFLIENIGFLDSILCRRVSYTEFAFAPNQVIDSNITILSGSGFLDSVGHEIALTYTTQIRNSMSTRQLNLTR